MARTIWGHPACLVSVGPNPLGALGGLSDGFVVCQMKVISSVEARSWRVQSLSEVYTFIKLRRALSLYMPGPTLGPGYATEQNRYSPALIEPTE